jgi:hypothetical protein
MEVDSATPSAGAAQTSQNTTTATNSLPEDWVRWLNPNTGQLFVPWPSEENIRKGALASIEVLMNQGVDPATFDPEMSAELEAERRRLDEEEARRAEDIMRLQEEQRRRMSVGGSVTGERVVERPKVFQLESFDDDDDDEDEH